MNKLPKRGFLDLLGSLCILVYAGALLMYTPTSVLAKDVDRYKRAEQVFESLPNTVTADLIRAMAWVESGWRQFNDDGTVYVDGSMSKITHKVSKDFGIMQINEKTIAGMPPKFVHKVKCSTKFNILIGVAAFEGKIRYVRQLRARKYWRKIWKRYDLYGLPEQDIAIIAYNGFQVDHIYLRLVKGALKDKPWLRCLEGSKTPVKGRGKIQRRTKQ